jgi:hypothetical protein
MAPRGAVPPTAEYVIGAFPHECLSGALAATHRAGFGPHTRVLDGVRGDIAAHLDRAGLWLHNGTALSPDVALIVVAAPGRATAVAELFAQLGAESVLFASRRHDERPASPRPPLLTPDIRIDAN